ncbi:DUF1622 domain-containing protein [Roseobacter denitrificans]|uniref:DUF1622 domain-containing protein n=2 Tax=Roseobacter denitrificans TaxID=2434 RepID=Q16C48_ROSDO|nr:DUF1622 domain-containing protein [Roseobacter denitrificans]ABG30445.1 conserved hypothetical protein [Roseobacter denitrificans OCh 114]
MILLLTVGLFNLVVRTVRLKMAGESPAVVFIRFRINLGQLILLALEILIVSDILHSIAHRTLEDLIVLGAIVVIRILLAYFLDRELSRLDARISTIASLRE